MKTLLVFLLGAGLGSGAVWLTLRSSDSRASGARAETTLVARTDATATPATRAPENTPAASPPAPAPREDPLPLAVPAPATAEWVRTAQEVDRRYGIVYRICSLTPAERKLVRGLLTREALLDEARKRALAEGLSPDEVERRFGEEQRRLDADRETFAEQAPEVVAFLDVCRQHPHSLNDAAVIADRIVVETGAIDPDVAETIFSAIVHADVDHPMPPFLITLDLAGRTPAELQAAEQILARRNAFLIPDLSGKLPLNQTLAAISYYEEQLDAVKKQQELHAHHP